MRTVTNHPTTTYNRFINLFIFSFLFFIHTFSLHGTPSLTTEKLIVNRVQAHLLIHDYSTACKEAKNGLKDFPKDESLWDAYIQSLAKLGNEKEMMIAWDQYTFLFPEAYKKRELIEKMAWSLIHQGSASSLPMIRSMGLMGAFFAQDAKGISVLHKHLNDSNYLVRAIAVELAGHLSDAKLCDAMITLLRKEHVWQVHLQAIKAVGLMKIKEAKPDLIKIIGDNHSTAEEKAAAIQSIVVLLDTVDRPEIMKLVSSDRSGLRILACQVVSHFKLDRDLDCIIPLLKDHSFEVRIAALKTLGVMRSKIYDEKPLSDKLEPMLHDPNPKVAICAAWVLTLMEHKRGLQAFEFWLFHEKQDLRILAAAALAACGKYSLPLSSKTFSNSKDPYVRMNLAIGLIGIRENTQEACKALYDGLTKQTERWMWEDNGYCKAIKPSDIRYTDSLKEHPEEKNQLVRLEILNIVAMLKYPKAQEAVIQFLQQKTWGISASASALLLTEGDENALDIVSGLLDHSTHKVRVQAALILAMWGRDEKVISILQENYEKGDRELKEKILEGLGRIGAQSSIPFLVEKMKEPHQSIRIIAACALLQCLYH